jgi:hypothetical protein
MTFGERVEFTDDVEGTRSAIRHMIETHPNKTGDALVECLSELATDWIIGHVFDDSKRAK